MSNAPAAAGGAAAPAAGASPKTEPLKNVPADIRRRVMGTLPPAPIDTLAAAEAEKERLRVETETAEKKKKEDADKLLADEEEKKKAAGAAAGDSKPRVKKVKDGPALPAADTVPPDIKSLVRTALDEDKRANAPAAPLLSPEVERELELARFAETKNPEKYAGFSAKVTTFFTSRDELLGAKAKELGGNNSPGFRDYLESDEFKGWLEGNRPAYARGDRTKLAEDLIADRARTEATREMQPKLKAMERKTAELEHGPTIKTKTSAALRMILTDPNAEKDPALEGFFKDANAFGEAHPEEAQVIASEAAAALDQIEEVYRIEHDLVDFDPRVRPQQEKIREFMIGQNVTLRKDHPNGIEMADGKILIDADTFQKRSLGKDPRYRVFNADEMAGMIAATSNARVLEKLKRRREGVVKSIYSAKKPAEAPAAIGQEKKTEEDPPAPGSPSSRAPGERRPAGTKETLAKKYA